MNLGNPLHDVAPGVRGALLRALARLEVPVTRRELAAAAGVAPGHASGVIDELIGSGLVTETRAGRASMVTLNRKHLFAAPIMAMAGSRAELISRLRLQFAGWTDVSGAWLFGSVARGEADDESDIDILLIADDLDEPGLHERITELSAEVRSWTGNELQLVEHTPASWQRLRADGNLLIDAIRQDGIPLTDSPTSHLARR